MYACMQVSMYERAYDYVFNLNATFLGYLMRRAIYMYVCILYVCSLLLFICMHYVLVCMYEIT